MAKVTLDDLKAKRRELGQLIRKAERASNRNLRAEEIRNRTAQRSRDVQETVREIGPPPDIVNADRRESCRHDLEQYLTTYHPSAFSLGFSDDHRRLIKVTQQVLLDGGQVVAAFPRGSGKTTIFQRAELWSALYGHRRYPMLISADDQKFRNLLKGVKTILENNLLLLEDFPEIVHPIRAIERIANRANFQMCRGEPTYMRWGIEQIIFPTTEESKQRGNAGIVIGGGGLTGAAIRGGVATSPTGEQVRPDAVLIDDPQTRKSAKSQSQCQEREDIISGDILGMAGPGKTMAAMVACTVIYRDDLAARLLDQERSPNWTPIKVSTIKAWPKAMATWEQYDAIRRQELAEEMPAGSATTFYESNRAKMDEGASVYWNERVDPGCVSALQTAMNDYFRDPRAFMAERQNSPEDSISGDLPELSPLAIVKRTHNFKRELIPPDASVVVCHVDVQAKLLYYTVTAFTTSGRGYVIDYGTCPRQNRLHFSLLSVRKTIEKEFPGLDQGGSLRSAIVQLTQALAERSYTRADGATLKLDRGLVDARWLPEQVEAALLESKGPWSPSYGVGIRAKDAPLAKWTKKRAVRRGDNWLIQKPDRRLLPSVFYDTNHWKTQVHQSLTVPVQHESAVTLYDAAVTHHQLWADHAAAERAVRVEAKGRIVDEWELPTNKPDNHYWDTIVGCLVAASACGVKRQGANQNAERKKTAPKRKVKQLAI